MSDANANVFLNHDKIQFSLLITEVSSSRLNITEPSFKTTKSNNANSHLRQGPICNPSKGTSIIVDTCRIIKSKCILKTLIIIFSNGWTIRMSLILGGHLFCFIHYSHVRNIGHGLFFFFFFVQTNKLIELHSILNVAHSNIIRLAWK